MRGMGFEPTDPLRDRISQGTALSVHLKSCAFDQALQPSHIDSLKRRWSLYKLFGKEVFTQEKRVFDEILRKKPKTINKMQK